MTDDLAPLSFLERIARLEERIVTLVSLLDEMRGEQKKFADTMARASGGLRMLMMLGGLGGAIGLFRSLSHWAGSLIGHVSGTTS